jgi:cytochrome b561
MLKNTRTKYGLIAKIFHWGMALLFFGMFPLGYIMEGLADSDFKFSLFDLHKATGLILFSLVALRLFWRFISDQPGLDHSVPLWQRRAASGNIIFLYLLMIAMPVSGFFMSTLGGHDISFYGLFIISPLAHDKAASGIFANIHEYVSYIMIAAFILHLLGALYHHYVLKDNVLKRMVVDFK